MESAWIQPIVNAIQTLGFAVVVALWLMFRTDKRIDALTAAVTALTDETKKLITEVVRREHE